MPSVETTPSADAVATRLAAHQREQRRQRRWRMAVPLTSVSFLILYLGLVLGVRVTELAYLIVNLLAIMTAFCGIIVHRTFEYPTILAELPRLEPAQRRINLAAIAPIRTALLGLVLPALGLAGSKEEAAAIDDDELVRRLAGLDRPDWRRFAPTCFVAWLVVVVTTLVAIATYRPEFGVSLIERAQGHEPRIERHWSPRKR